MYSIVAAAQLRLNSGRPGFQYLVGIFSGTCLTLDRTHNGADCCDRRSKIERIRPWVIDEHGLGPRVMDLLAAETSAYGGRGNDGQSGLSRAIPPAASKSTRSTNEADPLVDAAMPF
jgi:hypothetical protein